MNSYSSRLPAGDLTARIRGHLEVMSGANKVIAAQILDDPAVVTTYSIGELAAATGTSQASITRFCRAIGLSGYPQLRLSLAAEFGGSATTLSSDLGSNIEPGDSAEQVARIVAASNLRALQQTVQTLDYAAVAGTAEAIVGAHRVELFGVGGSAVTCLELQLRLQRIGRPAWYHPDIHLAKTSACQLSQRDVLFAVSRGGRTQEVIDVLDSAAERGATTIAVTSFERSPLAQRADIVVLAPVQDTDMRHGSLPVKYAQLAIADCVYSAVAQLTFDESTEGLARTSRALVSHRVAHKPRGAATSETTQELT